MFRLDGHAALITGGTQGVGAAIAVSLARAGANVMLIGLEPTAASEETMRVCHQCGVEADVIYRDLSQATPELAQEVFQTANERFPGLDLLVNNAGIFREPPFLESGFEALDRTMRLNVYAGFFLTQVFAKHWVAHRQAGRVLFTGSINGILSEPDHVAYDASKGAVAAMVRSLCVSLAPHGIRVNSMAPGLVRTPLTNQVLDRDPEAVQWMELHTPNRSVPGPEVCGPAAVFLLSDEASHIHGQTLYVDGGMSAWQQPDLPPSLRKG